MTALQFTVTWMFAPKCESPGMQTATNSMVVCYTSDSHVRRQVQKQWDFLKLDITSDHVPDTTEQNLRVATLGSLNYVKNTMGLYAKGSFTYKMDLDKYKLGFH